MVERTRGTTEMTAAMVISGTIGIFVVLSGQPVFDVVFWRCLFGALTLLVVCGALGYLKGGLLGWSRLGLAALSGVAIVLNWLLLFAAYPRVTISIATAVYNTQPFMLVGLGTLLLDEKIGVQKLRWLGLSFAGMLLVVIAKPGPGANGGVYLTGIAMALGAAFFYALAAIAIKQLRGTPPHLIALVQVTVGLTMLAPFVSWRAPPHGAGAWAVLMTLGLVHTGGMYILLYGAIQKLPTNLVGALSFINPVAAIAADLIVFGHRPQPVEMLGALVILLAAAGMTLDWRTRKTRAVACRSKAGQQGPQLSIVGTESATASAGRL